LLVGVFLVLAPLAALAYVRLHRPVVEISRRIGSPAVHDGDTTMVTLFVDNRTRRPVHHLTMFDEVDKLGGSGFQTARLAGIERACASYRSSCGARVVCTVWPVTEQTSVTRWRLDVGGLVSFVDRLVECPALE